MAMTPWIALGVVLLFAGASFFFSLAETSLFSLTHWQAKDLATRDLRRGPQVERLLAQSPDVLAAMVLGNTFANAAMIATALWMAFDGQWSMAGTLIGLPLLILVGCEVLPKTLAVRRPEAWALRVAGPVGLLARLLAPFRIVAQTLNTWVLQTVIPRNIKPQNALTEADYQELLELAFQQGTLEQSERDIILQILSLDRRTAREVMRPRTQMAAIPDDLSVEEMITAARRHRHRRLPMYDETPDTIVGVLNTRALLLDPGVDLADAIEFPSFVPETMNLLQLMKSLQRQQRGMAIVLDEFGGTAGIVTLEDIISELVGKMRGELTGERLHFEKTEPGKWRLSGAVRLEDFRREYPALGEVPDVETVGGLMMHLLQVVPGPGDSAQFRNLKLTAVTTDERRVREILAEVLKP
jgi:CBS domain containing-hemolysin-like protein